VRTQGTGLGLAVALACVIGCKPSAAGLVEQALIARGGLARLQAVNALRLTGKISAGSVSGTFRIEFKRPNRMRMEIGLPSGTLVRVFDGTSGWTRSGAPGNAAFDPMSAEQLAQVRREADMDGPLLDSKAKGIRIALGGKGSLAGHATDVLDITYSDGTGQRYQLDAVSHEPAGWEDSEAMDGKKGPVLSTVRAARREQGLLFPTFIESGPPGKPATRRISIERIELNPALDDARFRPDGAGGPR
jgi:hypothetical protein